jgi:hypothetical protein
MRRDNSSSLLCRFVVSEDTRRVLPPTHLRVKTNERGEDASHLRAESKQTTLFASLSARSALFACEFEFLFNLFSSPPRLSLAVSTVRTQPPVAYFISEIGLRSFLPSLRQSDSLILAVHGASFPCLSRDASLTRA